MKPNVNIYGSGVEKDSTYYPDLKFANFDDSQTTPHDMQGGVLLDKIKYGELIDDSISFVAVGKGSSLNYDIQMDYINQEQLGDIITPSKVTERTATPIFFTSNSLDGHLQFRYKWESGAGTNRYLITNFDYSKLLLCVQVRASSGQNVSAVSYIDLYNWVNNVNGVRSSYPICRGLTFIGFYGNKRLYSNLPVYFNGLNIAQNVKKSALDVYNPTSNIEFISYETGVSIPMLTPMNLFTTYLSTDIITNIVCGNPELWRFRKLDSQHYDAEFIGQDADLYKECAFLGLWFADKSTVAVVNTVRDENCTNPNIFLPEINETGMTTGKYFNGEEIKDIPNAKWKTDAYEKTGYTGIKDIDDNTYTDRIDLPWNSFVNSSPSTRKYIMTGVNIDKFNNWLWDSLQNPSFDLFPDYQKLYGNDVSSGLISLISYPFDVRLFTSDSGAPTTSLAIGNTVPVDSSSNPIKANIFTTNLAYVYAKLIGSFKMPKINNYLDIEPYTRCKLYIPYCGEVDIPLSKFNGGRLNIYFIPDFNTGNCSAVIYADSIPVMTTNGTCGVQVPLTSSDMSNIVNANINGFTNSLGSLASLGVSAGMAASGNLAAIGGIVSGVTSLVSTDNNWDKNLYTPEKIVVSGAAGATTSTFLPQYCYCTFYKPIVTSQNDYAETVGFSTDDSTLLSNYHGFTVAKNPIYPESGAGIVSSYYNMTEREKEMLTTALERGVILP